jgi:hypothetical protein
MVGGAGHALIATPVRVLMGSLLTIVGAKTSVQIATHASAHRESLQGSEFGKTIITRATRVLVQYVCVLKDFEQRPRKAKCPNRVAG